MPALMGIFSIKSSLLLAKPTVSSERPMFLYSQLKNDALEPILMAYSMRIIELSENQHIPYSFWG